MRKVYLCFTAVLFICCLLNLLHAKETSPSEYDPATVGEEEADPVVGADLATLTVDEIGVGGFNPVQTDYHVLLPPGTTVVNTLGATVATEGATVEIPESVDVSSGIGAAEFVVTAAGGNGTKTYTIHFTVIPPDNPEAKTIAFISADDHKDTDQRAWLIRQGFNVNRYYYDALGDPTKTPQSEIDRLNAADLVIIGRSSSSGHFRDANADAWNALTVPVIANSPYVGRVTRLNWFNVPESIPKVDKLSGEEAVVIVAAIADPTDLAFAGIELGENNTLEWMLAPNNMLQAPTTAPNGKVLTTINNTDVATGGVLFARFNAGEEFYPGAVDKPAGERVYFGFGNDSNSEGNRAHFFNSLTEDAKQVYRNEIRRLLGIFDEPLAKASNPTPANEEAGVMVENLTLSWTGEGESYNLYWGTDANNLQLVGESLTEPTYTPENVEAGINYYWRVDAIEGDEIAEGDVWYFSMAAAAGPLTKVSSISPANEERVIADNLMLGWEGNGDTYDVYLGKTRNNLSLIAEGLAAKSHTPLNLEENQFYYWRVDARRGDEILKGDLFGFTTTTATGIADFASQGITIYPNPLDGNSELLIDNAGELLSVFVYNAQGVLIETIYADNKAMISIPVEGMANGIYLLKAVKKDGAVCSGKFIK